MQNYKVNNMVTVSDLIEYLNTLAPFALQEDYDNSGLQLGNPDVTITGVLICLDVTSEVIAEAIEKRCNVVLSHHPMFFRPVRSINYNKDTGRIIQHAIKNNINVVAFHTNFDNQFPGLNQFLAQALGLLNVRVLKPLQHKLMKLVTFCPVSHADKVRTALFSAGAGHIGNYDSCSFNVVGFGTFRALEGSNPYVGQLNELHKESEERIEVIFPSHILGSLLDAMIKAHPYEEVAYDVYPLVNTYPGAGSGIIGDLPESLAVVPFIGRLKEVLGVNHLKVSAGFKKQEIKRIAICGGSGGFLITDAIRAGAEALITAEIKYHDFSDFGSQILLVDAGHYETEIHGFHQLRSLLIEKFPNFAVHFSETGRNPIMYI